MYWVWSYYYGSWWYLSLSGMCCACHGHSCQLVMIAHVWPPTIQYWDCCIMKLNGPVSQLNSQGPCLWSVYVHVHVHFHFFEGSLYDVQFWYTGLQPHWSQVISRSEIDPASAQHRIRKLGRRSALHPWGRATSWFHSVGRRCHRGEPRRRATWMWSPRAAAGGRWLLWAVRGIMALFGLR